MKFIINKVFWIAAALILFVGIYFLLGRKQPDQMVSNPILNIQKMGKLVSLKVNVADVIEFSKDRSLGIPWTSWQLSLGGTKILLIVRGDCTIATDLGAVTKESIDDQNRTITIVLPPPVALQPRLIHAPPGQGGTEIYKLSNKGIEYIIPGDANRGDAITSAMNLAQQKVEEAGKSDEVIEAAKINTELVLKSLFKATGWDVKIKWKPR
jgi:hypothetical protein